MNGTPHQQADSTSASGRSAFAELLQEGLLDECSATRVTELGERALRDGRGDPMLHAVVAQAYADRYRGESEDAHPDTLRLREPERVRAVEHFRQALDGTRDYGHRRQLWENATQLMAGLPISNRFNCITH
jgi:hypothetical protein